MGAVVCVDSKIGAEVIDNKVSQEEQHVNQLAQNQRVKELKISTIINENNEQGNFKDLTTLVMANNLDFLAKSGRSQEITDFDEFLNNAEKTIPEITYSFFDETDSFIDNDKDEFNLKMQFNSSIDHSKETFNDYLDDGDSKNIEKWKVMIKQLVQKQQLKNYILSRSRSSFSRIRELIGFMKNFPVKSDIEKAWSVFFWIAHNIDYDFTISTNMRNQDAKSTFKNGKAISSGYSNLFNYLLSAVFQLQSIKISGYAKGHGYNVGDKFNAENHDWNAVLISNKWYLVEPTWASGYGDSNKKFVKRFEPYYFFTPPEVFIYEHFPQNVEHQYLRKKISIEDFEHLPYYKLKFFLLNLSCLSHHNSFIDEVEEKFKLTFKASDNLMLSGYIEMSTGERVENAVFIQRELNYANIGVEVALQTNLKTKLRLFAGDKNDEIHEWICDFVFSPRTMIEKQPLFCIDHSFPYFIHLHEPKYYNLQLGKTYKFKVTVNANAVILVDSKNETKHFEKIDNEDNTWCLNQVTEVIGQLILSVQPRIGSLFHAAYEFEVVDNNKILK